MVTVTGSTERYKLDPEREYEIVNGKPVAKAMEGARHGGVCARLLGALGRFVMELELGGVYASNTSFKIGCDERMPDISFVTAERIPAEGEPEGLWQLAPDLAVEVVSPNDLHTDLTRKLEDYFSAGVPLVWVVEPELRLVTVYEQGGKSIRQVRSGEELTAGDVLPGFHVAVADLFPKTPPVAAAR